MPRPAIQDALDFFAPFASFADKKNGAGEHNSPMPAEAAGLSAVQVAERRPCAYFSASANKRDQALSICSYSAGQRSARSGGSHSSLIRSWWRSGSLP